MNDETQLTDERRLEKEEIEDLGTVTLARGEHVIHCLTVIGQIEGHSEAPQGQKTTKYEHVIPQLVAAQENPRIEGLLVLLNTVGGDVEAGLALAELIASVSKPSATLVLGGGHSIGIPLAVSARRSFIVPTATMTVHPVRHSGVILGVPQTMRSFEQMQQRITGFVAAHFFKLEDRCFYHPFEAKTISDIYCFLFCDILPSGDKSDPIAFCIGRSHLIDLFLRKGIQKLCNSCFIL